MTTETVEGPKTSNLPKRVAAVLNLVTPEGTKLKAIKYPMPLKAPRFNLLVNGVECEAAQTTFRDIKYTYFMFKDCSFYVPGHLNQELEYTFEFPDSYDFKPLKLDRKEQANKAAAKATKTGSGETEGSESGASDADASTGADAGAEQSTGEAAEASAAAPAPKKGKKASR